MSLIGNTVKNDKSFDSRYNYQKGLLNQLNQIKSSISLGGGDKAIAKQHAKGKLTARERIARLIDKDSSFFELNTLAAYEMYKEHGGAPSSGTVFGIGTIHKKEFVIVANDATVKAGAWFPITAKKNLRAQEIAMENNLPIIYLVDSAGVFLPLQDEIFPDKEHFGRIFRNNAKISAMGIPQISAIMGPCVAGGAYLPIMSDEALIVEGEGSVFLAGSHLVKAAIGEEIDNESLGGAKVQSNISGVTDYVMKNDDECLSKIRSLCSYINHESVNSLDRIKAVKPKFDEKEISGILPADTSEQYDMYELIARLIDNSEFDEYKAGYGKTIITGYARIDGWSVGIVANQRKVVKSESGEMQIGGVIYSDSADKAARFILNCNQKKIPLLFLQDVTGFMVGSKAEHGGIIKDGAKLVNAVANSRVPKITIIVGNSFGAGNYAMCGKAYDPRFIYAYPNAKIAVMGGSQASKVLLDIKLKQQKNKGLEISESEQKKMLDEIINSYKIKSNPYYCAARLWIDEIIDPEQTRLVVSNSLSCCNNEKIEDNFSNGVFQV
jgi:3-methylcrotonyl-CoA carboxylase beta subunit